MPTPVWTFASGGEVAEQYAWQTDVLAAATGEAQHRQLRLGPRISQTFDTLESANTRREMENKLHGQGAVEWLVPLLQDATQALTTSAGTLTFTVDGDFSRKRYKVGGSVLVIGDDPDTFDVLVVDAVSDYAMTTTALPAHTWDAGAWIMPLYRARLDAQPQLARFTGGDAYATIAWRFLEPFPSSAYAGTTYRGEPVLELHPDWSRDPEHQHERDLTIVDGDGAGLPTFIDLPGVALANIVASYGLVGQAQIADTRDLLYHLAGRFGAVWVPSMAQDLQVTGALAAGASTLDVMPCGFGAYGFTNQRRDIRIELVDGTILYRRIASVATVGAAERLTLSTALGVTRTAAQVRLVSTMTLCRQDSDIVALRYWRRDTAQVELRFKGLLDNDV